MNDKNDPYKPIECGLHSEYELAIMHKHMLQISWHDENGNEQHDNMVPMDLTTRNKQEYLVARDSRGEIHRIRLDKITKTNVDEVNRQ